jgi:hypothetical protein
VTSTDGANTYPTAATASTAITVNSVADAPSAAAPGTLTLNENASNVAVSGVSVGPLAEDGDDTVSASLTVAHGALNVGSAAGVTVSGNNGAALTLSGAAAAVNGLLAGLTYTPTAEYEGSDMLGLSVTSTDGSNTYPTAATASTAITVNSVADAPSVTVPAPGTTTESAPLVISGITFAPASGDGDDAFSMSLSVAHGALALGSSTGLTIISNGSNGTLAFSGTAANISAALASGVIYTPTIEYAGPDTLTVTGTDTEPQNGSTASNTQTLALTVALPISTAFTEMNDAVTGYLAQAGTSTTYTLVSGPSHDQSLQLAANGTYTYTPSLNYYGTDSFVYKATSSSGNVVTGTIDVDVARSGFGSSVPIATSGFFDDEYPGGDSVAPLSSGGFVATWVNGNNAYAQEFNQNGNSVSSQILVTSNGSYTSVVTGLTGGPFAGGFAVETNDDLYIYNSLGSLKQTIYTGVGYPSIDSAADGSIYLVSYYAGTLERFQAVNGTYSENASTSDNGYDSELKVLSNGDIAVLNDNGANTFGLYHSTSAGLVKFASGSYTGSPYYDDLAALDNGGFVISSGNSNDVEASIFTASGTLTATLSVPIIPNGDYFTHVSVLKGGGFVVAAINGAETSASVEEFNDSGIALTPVTALSTPGTFFIDTNQLSGGGYVLMYGPNSTSPIDAYVNYDAPLNYVGDIGSDAFVANDLNDTFTGGTGANIFQFGAYFGQDTITNFNSSKDVLLFNTAVFPNYATAIAHAASDGKGDTVITYNAYESVTLTGVTLSSLTSSNFQFSGTSQPAGTAGDPINLALSAPSLDSVNDFTVSVGGLPAGWTLNQGSQNIDGTWTAQTNDPANLAVIAPAGFAGASLLSIIESWTDSTGGSNTTNLADNVEVYQSASPIFAQSGDDTLTAGPGNSEAASSFAMASDGHGGTLITEAAAVAQTQPMQPHA